MDLKEIVSKYGRSEYKNDNTLNVFYGDEFPLEVIKTKHPNLDNEEYKYMQDNYVNLVKKPMGDAIFRTQKIFTDGNYTFDIPNDTINEYFWDYDIIGFFKNIYWQNIIIDSQSVLTVNIDVSEFARSQRNIELGNAFLPIKPYIVTSENIIYKDKRTLVYKVKGDKNFNFVVLEYSEFNKLQYSYYSFKSLSKEVTPVIFWEFDNKEVVTPYRKADGIKKVKDNELIIESYLSPSVPLLKAIMIKNNLLDTTQTRTTYPTPILVTEPCDMCNGQGKREEVVKNELCSIECKKCKGTGASREFNPLGTIYVSNNGRLDNQSVSNQPPFTWVDPPQGATSALSEQIDKYEDKVFDYIGIRHSNSSVKGTETALGKMIDREQEYSTYKNYSQDIQITMQWFCDFWTPLMFPLEKNNEIIVNAFHNFKTASTSEINAAFTELLNANAPQYQLINTLKEYYTSIGEIKEFEIVNKYFLYMSKDMAMKQGSLGYYDKTKIVISDNIMKWVYEVVDMDEMAMDSYLTEKAQSLMANPILTQ